MLALRFSGSFLHPFLLYPYQWPRGAESTVFVWFCAYSRFDWGHPPKLFGGTERVISCGRRMSRF